MFLFILIHINKIIRQRYVFVVHHTKFHFVSKDLLNFVSYPSDLSRETIPQCSNSSLPRPFLILLHINFTIFSVKLFEKLLNQPNETNFLQNIHQILINVFREIRTTINSVSIPNNAMPSARQFLNMTRNCSLLCTTRILIRVRRPSVSVLFQFSAVTSASVYDKPTVETCTTLVRMFGRVISQLFAVISIMF